MRPALALAATLLAGAGATHVAAHHSIAKFDGRRVVRIAGVVTGFRWINPHASIELDADAANGAGAVRWSVEMQAPSTLMEQGWRRDSLAAGDRVTLFANPLREEDSSASRRGLYVGAVLADGRTLGLVGNEQR